MAIISMDTVNDGILHGKLGQTKGDCEVCGLSTRCLHIYEVHMPEDIDVGKTIIAQRHAIEGEEGRGFITLIGIGCGCYAKFHRQVSHIQDKMKFRIEKKQGKKKKKHGRK